MFMSSLNNNRYFSLRYGGKIFFEKIFIRKKEKRKRIDGRRKVYGEERKICKRERENGYDVKERRRTWKEGRKEGNYLPLHWKFICYM